MALKSHFLRHASVKKIFIRSAFVRKHGNEVCLELPDIRIYNLVNRLAGLNHYRTFSVVNLLEDIFNVSLKLITIFCFIAHMHHMKRSIQQL